MTIWQAIWIIALQNVRPTTISFSGVESDLRVGALANQWPMDPYALGKRPNWFIAPSSVQQSTDSNASRTGEEIVNFGGLSIEPSSNWATICFHHISSWHKQKKQNYPDYHHHHHHLEVRVEECQVSSRSLLLLTKRKHKQSKPIRVSIGLLFNNW